MRTSVVKKLSANDIGDTGAHQAGILVPKQSDILSFFPPLDAHVKNPRMALVVREKLDATRWEFNFIYYNNRLFGGTRNEYRLTGMTKFFRSAGAVVNDELEFSKDENGSIHVSLIRRDAPPVACNGGVLVLSGGWKIVNI